MRRTLILILGVALVGTLAAVAVASQGADDPAGVGETVAQQTTTAENRTTTAEDETERVGNDDGQAGVDISGPCDETEHANDPRCTGAAVGDGGRHGEDDDADDNSGPGGGDDDSRRGRGRGRGDDSD